MVYRLALWCARKAVDNSAARSAWQLLPDLAFLISVLAGIYHFGIDVDALSFVLISLATILICVTDFKWLTVPDRVTLPLLAAGLLISGASTRFQPVDAVIGAAVGLVIMYSIGWVGSAAFGREALGGGDIKLTAALGSFVGWQGVIGTILLGSVLALLYVVVFRLLARKGSALRIVPLGPFLGFAALVTGTWMNLIGAHILRI